MSSSTSSNDKFLRCKWRWYTSCDAEYSADQFDLWEYHVLQHYRNARGDDMVYDAHSNRIHCWITDCPRVFVAEDWGGRRHEFRRMLRHLYEDHMKVNPISDTHLMPLYNNPSQDGELVKAFQGLIYQKMTDRSGISEEYWKDLCRSRLGVKHPEDYTPPREPPASYNTGNRSVLDLTPMSQDEREVERQRRREQREEERKRREQDKGKAVDRGEKSESGGGRRA